LPNNCHISAFTEIRHAFNDPVLHININSSLNPDPLPP
jgi:hypothetical protein